MACAFPADESVMQMETRRLTLLMFAQMQRISPELVAAGLISADVRIDDITRYMTLAIKRYVWSEELGRHTFKTPASWWQHLKQTHAPRWMLRRWPVVMLEEVWIASALYPDFAQSIPRGLGDRFNFNFSREEPADA